MLQVSPLNVLSVHFFPLLFTLFLLSGCSGPDAPIAPAATQSATAPAKDKPDLKAKIIAEDYLDRTGRIAGVNFKFYDEKGELVKTVADTAFPHRHPAAKLDFEKTSPEERHFLGLGYFKPLKDNRPGKSSVPKAKIKRELESLKRYGIVVQKPETATTLFCSDPPLAGIYEDKYAITLEIAYVYDYDGYTVVETFDTTNMLSQSSYISIYNHKGELYSEVLILDKIVSSAYISDDGKYLLTMVSECLLWDEGLDAIDKGDMVLVDLKTKKQTIIQGSEEDIGRMFYIFDFKNGVFEVGYGHGATDRKRKYVDPINRRVYEAHYPEGFKGTYPISSMPYFEF